MFGNADAVVTPVVRDARPADLAAVRAIYRRASLSNEGDRANLLAHPEVLEFSDGPVRDGRTRVATVDGVVVGFATPVWGDDAVELEDLFVDPRWMRRGVAMALVRDLVAAARGRVGRIEVSANPHAAAFYEAAGFVVDGVANLRWGVAPRMHLDIDPPPD